MGTELLREIGQRLTRIRSSSSQAEFAPRIGLHKNTLGTYERGDREIGGEALARLVDLGWNVNWLLTGEGPQTLAAPVLSHFMSAEHLTIAIELADKVLGDRWLPAPVYADLTAAMYDALQEGRAYEEILRSGLAIASRLFRGNSVEDNKPSVDSTHRDSANAGKAGSHSKKRKAG